MGQRQRGADGHAYPIPRVFLSPILPIWRARGSTISREPMVGYGLGQENAATGQLERKKFGQLVLFKCQKT